MLSDNQFTPHEEHIRNAQMGQMNLPVDRPDFRYQPGQTEHLKQPVEVYRNLNTTASGFEKDDVIWSAREAVPKKSGEGYRTGGGRVLGYSKDISLENVETEVNQAGRAQVQKTGKKNVHAIVRGTPTTTQMNNRQGDGSMYYNPKDERIDSFVDAGKLFGAGEVEPVTEARKARLSSTPEGKVSARYRK